MIPNGMLDLVYERFGVILEDQGAEPSRLLKYPGAPGAHGHEKWLTKAMACHGAKLF